MAPQHAATSAVAESSEEEEVTHRSTSTARSSIVAKLQPRSTPNKKDTTSTTTSLNRPSSSPTKRAVTTSRPSTPISSAILDAPRSSRSSGRPIIEVKLEGAPEDDHKKKGTGSITKPRKSAPVTPSKSPTKSNKGKRAASEVDTDTSSARQRGSPTKRKSPTKSKASAVLALGDDSSEDESDASSIAVKAQLLKRTPNKTPATYGARTTTPSSAASLSYSLSRPPPSTARGPRAVNKSPSRRASSTAAASSSSKMLVDSDDAASDEEEEEEEDDEPSDDELALTASTPAPSASTAAAQPKTPSPRKQSTSTGLPTPRRSSNRVQRLPIAQRDIEAAPDNLRSVLVGWHPDHKKAAPEVEDQEDSEGDESDLDVEGHPSALEKGKGRAVVSPFISGATASRSSPIRDHTRTYPAHLMHALYSRNLAVLSGASLPRPATTGASSSPSKGKSKQQELMDLPYLEGPYRKWEQPLRYAMKSVVEEGLGNCLMLLGPRGVGKTMLAERTLSLLSATYGATSFIPIRLNGLVHTTDRMALRSMAWQLGLGGWDAEGGEFGSNSATMTTLLRMLEPSSSNGKAADVSSKPIIILLDEFDLFAQHPRQSFLYCLLDIVQGNRRKKGMGVIGISARSDTLSILEKRVRSRCQSQVHQMVLPNDFEEYLRLAGELMGCDVARWEREGEEEEGALAREWMEEVKAFLEDEQVLGYFKRCWQMHGNTPTQLRAALTHLFYQLNHATQHSSWEVTSPAPSELTVPSLSVKMLLPEAKGARDDLALSHLTILELNILVAAKHLRSQHDNTLNLEMLFKCYLEHVGRGKINVASKPFTRAAFSMAFDHLRLLELFLPHTGKPTHHLAPSQASPFKMYRLVPWDSTIDEAFKLRGPRKDVPEELRKWCRDWAA